MRRSLTPRDPGPGRKKTDPAPRRPDAPRTAPEPDTDTPQRPAEENPDAAIDRNAPTPKPVGNPGPDGGGQVVNAPKDAYL
jgi:hypothetical protein